MAHYAKLSDQNKVLQVLSVDNSVLGNPENEALGRTHLENIHGWPADMWKQCSYNTMGGIYYEQNENNERVEGAEQSKALRGNYPGAGYIYDPVPTQPYEWNESTQSWDGPFTVENDPYA